MIIYFINETTNQIIYFYTYKNGIRLGKTDSSCVCHDEDGSTKEKNCIDHNIVYRYSKWLSIYYQMKYNYSKFNKEYKSYLNPFPVNRFNSPNYIKYNIEDFDKNYISFDLLAGCFATKLKFKKDYIIKTINDIKLIYQDCKDYYKDKIEEYEKVMKILEIGYDEIFLNELFIFSTKNNNELLKFLLLNDKFEKFRKSNEGLSIIHDKYYVDYLFRKENYIKETFDKENLSTYFTEGYSGIMSKLLNCPNLNNEDIENLTKMYFNKKKDLIKDGKSKNKSLSKKFNKMLSKNIKKILPVSKSVGTKLRKFNQSLRKKRNRNSSPKNLRSKRIRINSKKKCKYNINKNKN